MLVLGLTALRPRAAGRPAVRMDLGVTAPDNDDADLLRRMARQRLLGKTETQILEEMVKSEMGLDMDLSFFDDPAPPMDDGEASKTLESLKSHIDDEASKTLESMAGAEAQAQAEAEAQVVAEAEARVLLSVQARADQGDAEASKLLESMMAEAEAPAVRADQAGSATGGGGGAGDEAEMAEMLEGMFGSGALRDETPAAGNPLAGEEFWGRWSQNAQEIYLELYVDAETAAEKVSCEVGVGFLDVRIGWMPLLSGRLAQGMLILTQT